MKKKIVVYRTNYCPFCDMAKRLLQQHQYEFEEVNLDGQDELRMKLSKENGGWRTVPMIFIGDEFVGGFDELNKLAKSGDLAAKVG